jgi:GxxExxY protein
MRENEIAAVVVDVAYQIHTKLGPGLLESVYQAVMAYELRERGLKIETEVPIPIHWGDIRLEVGFRVDILVERSVIVELKSVQEVAPVHKKQLLTYLKLTDCHLGLLINFNADRVKDGITRIAYQLPEPPF